MLKNGYKVDLTIKKSLKYPLSILVFNAVLDAILEFLGGIGIEAELVIPILSDPKVLVALFGVVGVIAIYDFCKHGLGWRLW